MEKVCVMLSSYNGSKFIKNQIDSVFSQENLKIVLYVRDDGSCDETEKILKFCKRQYGENMVVEYGKNLGWKQSFLKLIFERGYGEFDYYCISDQDDMWETKKVSSAIKKLKKYNNIPCMYGSNLELVDTDMNRIGYLYSKEDVEFDNLKKLFMLGNAPFGCTLVWNSELQKVLLKGKPKVPVAYDQWINLVANCQGKVVLDIESHIRHIIHGDNACGVSKNLRERIKKFFKIYMSSDYISSSEMVKEYFRIYGESGSNKYMNLLYALISSDRFEILKQAEIQSLTWKKRIRIFMFCVLGIM